ncbi:MAG: hypothetical protein HY954_07380 [Deltaproteobacteria bacterium]|nr:hypothetical protein [Deltaproteobacteria bacterium]
MTGPIKTIMVIGDADSGKTAFCEALAGLLSEHFETGAADLDMGQSHIGPPSTIAWGKAGKGHWDDIEMEDMYFTGALSPPGNLLPLLAGAKKIVESAAKRSEKLVIDTTGLVRGPLGRLLKQYKIELLLPDMVVALEREGELRHIIEGFRLQKTPVFERIDVPGFISFKSVLKRTEYRADKFRKYFSGSRVITVSRSEVGLRFTSTKNNGELAGRLISLRDEMHKDIALGIIEGVDPERDTLLVRTPLAKGAGFSTLVIGTAVISL